MTTYVMPEDKTLFERLKMARQLAGLEQSQLAALVGTSRTSISNYENGVTEPTASVFVRWARVTGVPLEWLAGGVRPEGFEPPTYCSVADEIVCQCGHADFKHDGFGDCLVCGCVDWQGDIDAELRALLEAVAS